MWYNRMVWDKDNNVIIKERMFIVCEYGYNDSFGLDILGNWVEEWWD
jgi:hypothetical protein